MKYSDVCEAKTRKEMRRRFSLLLREIGKQHPGSPLKVRRHIQSGNVGYVAGYYDAKVLNRVRKWLGASHPVFG